ncbi:MAG: TIM barrel protein [Bryobacteraceae bacterium]
MDRRTFLAATGSALLANTALGQQITASKKARITSSVMLWTLKGTVEEKMEAAAKAGSQSVGFVDEYFDWSDADFVQVKRLADSFHLGIETISGTPYWKKRPVSMVDPAQRGNFLKDVRKALVHAQKFEIPQIILMCGNEMQGRARGEQYAGLVESTKRAGDLAATADRTLIIECLNVKGGNKGYFLPTASEGLKLVREADNPHVRLLFDIYHEQLQTGDVTRILKEATPHVGAFHVADCPRRHEPGTGELNFGEIYRTIRDAGYSGYIAMEYYPVADPVQSLIKSLNGMRAALDS